MDDRNVSDKKYGGYISKIKLNDGTEIKIRKMI
ncbi:hypothetical protein CIY_26880 [Butyrivibrio fibrisolvens 16/4]|nr:hypothetical protein CIY_26880 [Butyrivibrio fibrisolvens 16/4]